jgi:NitT/TauT family transport system substrate-binding protein
MKTISFCKTFLIPVLIFLSACSLPLKPDAEPTPVTVQLKWVHQAQFAGFYVAAEKGFYAEENIDISIAPGGVGINILDEVSSGRAQFGVIGAEKVISARENGALIKAIAVTYRRNPFVIVSLPESDITKPADLIGKTANLGGIDGYSQFVAMMSRLNLDANQVNIIPYTYDLQPFLNGQVDATPAIAAGSLLGIQKVRPDVNLIWAEDYGIHFYSDTIITTDQLIADDPALVERFVRATLKGHHYAIENPEEAVNISIKYAKDPDPDVQSRMMIASIPLINTGEDQIGWMREEVWKSMQSVLYEQGLISKEVDPSEYFTMQFLEKLDDE